MRVSACLLGLFVAMSPARAEGPRREACGSPDAATQSVKLAFSDLVNLHRARIPGPSGQRVLDGRVDRLLDKTIDLERFAAGVLTPMWDELEPDKKSTWASELRIGLRGHYLKRLTGDTSPVGQRLDIVKSEADCDQATVELTLGPKRGRTKNEVTLRLHWTGLAWRAWDVTVDGVSLLETWKNRFRSLYRDGGVAAVDEHLKELAERYRTP